MRGPAKTFNKGCPKTP